VLLLVGQRDQPVLALNQQAAAALRAPHRLEVVAGATHLFEEPGTLAEVAEQASEWFETYLRWTPSTSSRA
jgi:putative phosphoribosyl transferase